MIDAKTAHAVSDNSQRRKRRILKIMKVPFLVGAEMVGGVQIPVRVAPTAPKTCSSVKFDPQALLSGRVIGIGGLYAKLAYSATTTPDGTKQVKKSASMLKIVENHPFSMSAFFDLIANSDDDNYNVWFRRGLLPNRFDPR